MSQVKIERRCEVRASQEEFAICGTAARFGVPSKPLPFTEVIDRRAFDRTLAEGKNVNFTFNHSMDSILARTDNDTLKLWTDDDGLQFRAQLNRVIQQHRDIYEACKAGLYRECSFAFMPKGANGDRWDGGVRTLLDVDLLDASLVGSPAYPQTSASARSTDTIPTTEELRARAARLSVEVASDNGDAERRAKAARLGAGIERENWFSPGFDSKEALLGDLQDAMDEQYGEACYRVIDACADSYGQRDSQGDEPCLMRGTLIARDLNADGEDFVAQDFEEVDEDDYQRARKAFSRKLRLSGRCRSCTPSGTMWQSSLRSQRAIKAAAEWTVRDQHREEEIRMATAAGNWSRVSALQRGRK